MSISERARSPLRDMPEHEKPLSEQFRLASKEAVRLKSIAKLAEDLKASKFAEMMLSHTDIAVSRAEIAVRASKEWQDHVRSICAAQEAADYASKRVKWIEMRFQEWVMETAHARAERQMGRHGT